MSKIQFDFESIRKQCKDGTFQILGKGTSRRCYDIGNGYVAKIAFTEAGLAQNDEELNLYDSDSLFNEIIDYSDDHQIIVTYKAEKVKLSQVWKLLEINRDEVFDYCLQLSANYSLSFGDLRKKSSWGIVGSEPVLIDYGCTRHVYEMYYRPIQARINGKLKTVRPKCRRIAV